MLNAIAAAGFFALFGMGNSVRKYGYVWRERKRGRG
jgi:hypothetical protein